MEKIKNMLSRHSNKLKYLFLCGALIAAINTLSRADYNFLIYVYMFYVWTFMQNSPEAKKQDKIATFYFLIFSLLIDFIWTIYWGGKWNLVPTLIHEMTLFFSWCGIVLKICIIVFIGLLEMDNIKESIHSLMKKKSKEKENFEEFKDDEK